jgi:hypothetical protein
VTDGRTMGNEIITSQVAASVMFVLPIVGNKKVWL